MKTHLFITFVLILVVNSALSQQWNGNNDVTGPIQRSGNVGIGLTTTPTHTLTIRNDSGIPFSINRNSNTNGHETGLLFKTHNVTGNTNHKGGIFFERTGSGGIGSLHFATTSATTTNNVSKLDARMTITANGNVGIGTTDPNTASLMVHRDELPNIVLRSALSRLQIGIANNGWDFAAQSIPGDVVFRNLGAPNSCNLIFNMPVNTDDGNTYIAFGDQKYGLWYKIFNNRTALIDGDLGIGTLAKTGYKLAVKGKIIAEEVVVQLYDNWPDYVFQPEYNLRTLSEVEQHIQTHGHLPEVPSAQQVEANGFGVGEMNAILLKKVEELTLYVIELQKQVDELRESKGKEVY